MVEVGEAERVKVRGGLRDLIVSWIVLSAVVESSSSDAEVAGGSHTGTCFQPRVTQYAAQSDY